MPLAHTSDLAVADVAVKFSVYDSIGDAKDGLDCNFYTIGCQTEFSPKLPRDYPSESDKPFRINIIDDIPGSQIKLAGGA